MALQAVSIYASGDTTVMKILRNTDVSELWRSHEERPLGYIGKEYERIYIHIHSVLRDRENPFLYHVQGKSRVKKNITSFAGYIRIDTAVSYPDGEYSSPDTMQGRITAHYEFSEECKEKHCGVFSGSLTTDFYYLRSKDSFYYDDLMGDADGFCNNMYQGTWESYDKSIKHVCNWGDERIPDSGDLDNGAGEFYPQEKYFSRGWKNYFKAYLTNTPDSKESRDARAREMEEWWK